MTSAGAKNAWLRTNQGIASVVAVLCAVLLGYLLTQDWVYQEQRDGFRLGFFSVMGAGAMLLCALSLLFDSRRSATTPELATTRGRHLLHALAALALMGVYFMLAWKAHFAAPGLKDLLDVIPFAGEFVFWTPVFLALGMYLLGVRPARSAIVAGVVIGLIVFGLFRLIGISLPSTFLLS